MNVCIDPGHGGADPGAIDGIDKTQDDDIYEDEIYTEESEVVLKVSKTLKCLLSDSVEVTTTRKRDIFIPLHKRANLANKLPVDLFVSIHANAASNYRAHGIETLYYPTSIEGRELASIIQDRLIIKTGATDRLIKPRKNLYVLKRTNMPAVLIELGFITNPREEHLLNSHSYQYLLAEAICEGIIKYGRDTNEL